MADHEHEDGRPVRCYLCACLLYEVGEAVVIRGHGHEDDLLCPICAEMPSEFPDDHDAEFPDDHDAENEDDEEHEEDRSSPQPWTEVISEVVPPDAYEDSEEEVVARYLSGPEQDSMPIE